MDKKLNNQSIKMIAGERKNTQQKVNKNELKDVNKDHQKSKMTTTTMYCAKIFPPQLRATILTVFSLAKALKEFFQ